MRTTYPPSCCKPPTACRGCLVYRHVAAALEPPDGVGSWGSVLAGPGEKWALSPGGCRGLGLSSAASPLWTQGLADRSLSPPRTRS